jgi:hypothetical protein
MSSFIDQVFKRFKISSEVEYYEILTDKKIIYLEYYVRPNQFLFSFKRSQSKYIIRDGKVYRFFHPPKNLEEGKYYLADIFPAETEEEFYILLNDLQNEIVFADYKIYVSFIDNNSKRKLIVFNYPEN